MRTDPNEGAAIQRSVDFEKSARKGAESLRGDDWVRKSLSGNEPNRFFWSERSRQFHDLSLLSGMDHAGDGRALVVFDYDRDGWIDVAAINTNAPKLLLFHNRFGRGVPSERFVAVRLRGGNRGAAPDPLFSNRSAIGARVELLLPDGRSLIRELHCGEGFSAQNSSVIHFGIGDASEVLKAVVRWPSDRVTEIGGFPAGSLLEVDERDAPGDHRISPWTMGGAEL